MMDRIVDRVERDPGWRELCDSARLAPEHTVADAIADAARQIANTIGAKAIAAYTASGSTALRIARTRPACPVLGLTTDKNTARRMAVVWGVHAVVTGETHSMTETVDPGHPHRADGGGSRPAARTSSWAAGVPFGMAGTTNALRVASVK